VPWFDFAHLPPDVDVPSPVPRAQLLLAGVAWETATCWVAEPEYAAAARADGRCGKPNPPSTTSGTSHLIFAPVVEDSCRWEVGAAGRDTYETLESSTYSDDT
jgi:hypothetical protein